ncbi:MAG: DUF3500 domain-containing protein [Planctomycetales bacterium]|nr:DUF3500 domain-containing protein [Planctomycetales bacterium]
MSFLNRRQMMTRAGGAAALVAAAPMLSTTEAEEARSDSLPMQLYKSLSDEQREKICLPADHARRQFISNWWYVAPEYRLNHFKPEQQELITKIFDSLHHPEYREAVNKQVKHDQYGKEKNIPSVAFFGTPDDSNFEFIYTGHHVTRRCDAHTDEGRGLNGAPLFYGHFFNTFNESPEHVGNPYWYQGKLFNEFVQSLDEQQQQRGLATVEPRAERSPDVVKSREQAPGLAIADLQDDQRAKLLETIGKMLVMFRESDVAATLKAIRDHNVLEKLHVSWYGGKYDIGDDKVWDTWTMEGPTFVWYFRGQPHIHSYFDLKV